MAVHIIHKSNLKDALYTAIVAQEKFEREELKFTRDSGMLAVWRETLEAIENGSELIMNYNE